MLQRGCLKCTLSVVFEALSYGTCGRGSAVAELSTVLQWLV